MDSPDPFSWDGGILITTVTPETTEVEYVLRGRVWIAVHNLPRAKRFGWREIERRGDLVMVQRRA